LSQQPGTKSDVDGTWIQAAVAPVIALLVVWRGSHGVTTSYLAAWQARFSVEVTSGHDAFVRGRLRRARSTRAVMAAIGIVVAGMPSYMNLIDAERSSDFANPLVGNAWLFGAILGALAAEVLVIQRPARRVASTLVRRPVDYVDGVWIRWVAAAVPVTTVMAAASTAIERWRWWYGWIGVGGALLAAGALALGLRSITYRAALAPAGELRGIDDALRADGAHHLAGAAVALAGMSLAEAVPQDLTGWWALVALPVSLIGLLALGAWWTIARDIRWSVDRARAHA
jgi:hypothetical protein